MTFKPTLRIVLFCSFAIVGYFVYYAFQPVMEDELFTETGTRSETRVNDHLDLNEIQTEGERTAAESDGQDFITIRKSAKASKILDLNEIQTENNMRIASESNEFDLDKIRKGAIATKQKLLESKALNDIEPETKSGAKYDVILNAYKHSGSTATGRILSNRMDTFYVHEPFWQVATHTFYKGPCLFCKDFPLDTQNNSCIKPEEYCVDNTSVMENAPLGDKGSDSPKSKVWDVYYKSFNESFDFLQSILDCDFHRFQTFFYDPKLPNSQKRTVHSIFYHYAGWIQFRACRKKKSMPFSTCLLLAEKSCRSAKHRVIKLLRMTLDNLAPLLERNPKLKVIHLFRDPRGIFNSKVGASLYPADNQALLRMRSGIKTMCERLKIDLDASEMLKRIYPGRMKVIQYERLFAQPLSGAAKDLYTFAGMDYGTKQQDIIRTDIKQHNSGGAGFHPFNYRTRVPWNVIQLFDKECSEVLDRLGYTRYKDKAHLKDLSRSGFAAGTRS